MFYPSSEGALIFYVDKWIDFIFSLLDDKKYSKDILPKMTDEHELVLDVGWSSTTSLPLMEGFRICKIIHNNGHNNNVNHTILTPGDNFQVLHTDLSAPQVLYQS